MKKIITKFGIIGLTVLPFMVFAQNTAQNKDLKYLVSLALGYFNIAISFIISLGILMFIWNVYKYFIAGSDNSESKKEAGLYVMWSVIGFFVILSIWGLVNILLKTFKLDNNVPATPFGIFTNSQSSAPGPFQAGNATNNGVGGNATNNGGGYYDIKINDKSLIDSPRQKMEQPNDQIQS